MVDVKQLPPAASADLQTRQTTNTTLPEAEETYQYEPPKTGGTQTSYSESNQNGYNGSARNGHDDAIDAEWSEVKDNPENDELKRQRREEFKAERAMQKAKREVDAEKNSFANKAKEKIKGAASAGWGRLKKNISAPAQRADDIRNRNTGQLTKADLNRALREKKGRESKGQFKQPRYGSPFGGGGKVSGTFPDIDPFGGMGGKGRNMLDLSFGGMGQRPQQQQPQRQAPPKPKPQPMRFPDPFAGLKKSSGNSKQNLKVMGKGLGTGRKEGGKKLKKMKDWFDF